MQPEAAPQGGRPEGAAAAAGRLLQVRLRLLREGGRPLAKQEAGAQWIHPLGTDHDLRGLHWIVQTPPGCSMASLAGLTVLLRGCLTRCGDPEAEMANGGAFLAQQGQVSYEMPAAALWCALGRVGVLYDTLG